MTTISKAKNKIREIGISRGLFGVYMSLVLFIVTFVAPFINYYNKKEVVLLDPFYLLIGSLAAFGLIFIVQNLKQNPKLQTFASPKKFRYVVIVSCIVLFLLQLFVINGAWFKTNWDVKMLTSQEFQPQDYVNYFSMYPNQLLLAGVFSKIIKISNLLGIPDSYLTLVVIGTLCVNASIGLVAFVARKLGGYSVGYAFLFVAVIFLGFSPWFLVPYSDTYAMLWTSLTLWLYVCCEKNIKWPLFAFCVYIGYCIKPTVIFVAIAVALIQTYSYKKKLGDWKALFRLAKTHASSFFKTLVSVVVAVAISIGIVSFTSIKYDGLNKEQNFTFTHYLMMGFNNDYSGNFNQSDVDISYPIDTVNNRQRVNLKETLHRIKTMGPIGTLDLLTRKTCVAFSDGSFAWAIEGSFYMEEIGSDPNLRKIYGMNREHLAADPNLFDSGCQVIWLPILLGCVAACFLKRKHERFEDQEKVNADREDGVSCSNESANTAPVRVICLTLLFLGAFLTLFECRARYLFLYAPYFVLLGTLGWARISEHALYLKHGK